MLKIAQFRNKVRSHGLPLALRYSAEFMLRPLWRTVWAEPFRKTYSQRGEDLIIDEVLGMKETGTYLDVGAYDPHHLSNTKRFYDRGWRGCNVEPNPERFKKLLQGRPRDTNLNIGLSDSVGTLTYYQFIPEVFSTFSAERAKALSQMGARIKAEIEVPVITMKDLFAQYFNEETVDICTIDAEGMDSVILRGNDWDRFRPRVICIEATLAQVHQSGSDPGESIESLLTKVGYIQHSVTRQYGVPLNEIYVSRV